MVSPLIPDKKKNTNPEPKDPGIAKSGKRFAQKIAPPGVGKMIDEKKKLSI